jgi:hypothetical protein
MTTIQTNWLSRLFAGKQIEEANKELKSLFQTGNGRG